MNMQRRKKEIKKKKKLGSADRSIQGWTNNSWIKKLCLNTYDNNNNRSSYLFFIISTNWYSIAQPKSKMNKQLNKKCITVNISLVVKRWKKKIHVFKQNNKNRKKNYTVWMIAKAREFWTWTPSIYHGFPTESSKENLHQNYMEIVT